MFSVWLGAALVPMASAQLHHIFDPLTFLFEALLCFLLLTLSCWADEYGDAEKGVDNAARLGPIRPLQRGLIPSATMLRACALLAVAVFTVGVLLVAYTTLRTDAPLWMPLGFVGMGVLCVLAAFGYTMGKRPYGYRGWGDLSAYLFFGPIAGLGGYYLYGLSFDWLLLLPVSATGLLLVVTINLQNIRDLSNDRACGKRSTAVCLGLRGACVYHRLLVGAALLLFVLYPVSLHMTSPLNYIFIVGFVPLIRHLVHFSRLVRCAPTAQELPEEQARSLDTLMWPLARGMGIVAVLFAVSICL
jgi:1,4-dihydroxy-2-naphthoate octaprenyltransferase